MNDYESRRQEKIKQNQKLLAELDIKPIIPKTTRDTNTNADGKPPIKKRKIFQEPTAPARTSARIAAAPAKATYNEEEMSKSLPRSRAKKTTTTTTTTGTKKPGKLGSIITTHNTENSPLPPTPQNIEAIQAGWTSWTASPLATPPTRDENQTLHFADHPTFLPNKTPSEILREGCFGGSYYRPLRSRKLGILIQDDWKELPPEWLSGLNIETFLTNPDYDPEVNKYKVSCGQSIEEWEAAGWISHEHDVRGWFQWYTRFYRGRRCEDDERQISRWKKCVGETGRWRRMLLKKYVQQGVRTVFDDGEEEDAVEVSPVMHQTCHHWAFEVRQQHLDAFWEEGGAR